MGCDIHPYISFKNGWEETESRKYDECWSVSMDRNYTVFGFLAGVRGYGPPPIPAKGLLEQLPYLYSNHVSGDCHSHSWLTTDEMRAVAAELWQQYLDLPSDFKFILATMEMLEGEKRNPIFLFCFDN